MSPELATRLRMVIDLDVRRRGTAWPPARVVHVHSTNALYEYYLGEGGEVYELDLDKAFAPLDFVDDETQRRATYAEAVRAHPELAELLDLPMPPRRAAPRTPTRGTYAYSRSTPMFYEQYDLELEDEGVCCISVGFSEPAGDAGGWSARGYWTQYGDRITFQFTESDKYASPPAGATVVGDGLDVDGLGEFRIP